MAKKLRHILFGKPRDISDPEVFHHVSLIAFLAWIGLGADGLSSSCYGPEEAFKALGPHTHLSLILIFMIVVTIAVISIAYSNLIEHFPGGGGGYLVATKLLGEKAGLISGCALLVDYVLTITMSLSAGCDALWSFFPPSMLVWKLPAEWAVLGGLVLLNLRGVKESVQTVAPIFMVFVITHFAAIVYAVASRFWEFPSIISATSVDIHTSVATLGPIAVAGILLHAYSLGGGTYTGIEAVSNGLTILREPRVRTGKHTMQMMAASLAFTAGGIVLGYLLVNAAPVDGKTMNAVLFESLFGHWTVGGIEIGTAAVAITLMSEAALLFVAAQTGFLDGPRILANMAVDSWMPHRFAQLSDRLVVENGVLVMGTAAAAALAYTKGDVTVLVVMYSINVFITFSLTELGMSRHWIVDREKEPKWKSQLAIHGTGLLMCLCILGVTLYEKFSEGGWVTTVVTVGVIALCFAIRKHYRTVFQSFKRLEDVLSLPPTSGDKTPEGAIDKKAPTAVVMVAGFSGFGIHQILSIQRLFPGHFRNFVFLSVAVLDSGSFKGAEEMGRLRQKTQESLDKYAEWCGQRGFHTATRMAVGTEVVQALEDECVAISKDFPRCVFFTGKLIFPDEKFYHRLLHNETAYAVQNRLQFQGLQTVILPIRVLN